VIFSPPLLHGKRIFWREWQHGVFLSACLCETTNGEHTDRIQDEGHTKRIEDSRRVALRDKRIVVVDPGCIPFLLVPKRLKVLSPSTFQRGHIFIHILQKKQKL
jgi:hypothetical protein